MSQNTLDQARSAALSAALPGTDITLDRAGVLVQVEEGESLSIELELGFPADRFVSALAECVSEAVSAVTGVKGVRVNVNWSVPRPAAQNRTVPGAGNVISVASGKGGVGKSTTAVNLALALAGEGARVGILDADIYGPSVPRMLGISGQRPRTLDGKQLEPLQAHGVQAMSIGFLIHEEQPMVWRGPMVTQALDQLLFQTRWDDLDYLIVDMPPGTGDTQLTLTQRVPMSGAVIVTTPQDIALLDARKGLEMFRKVEVPVLGVVENMSTWICPDCGHESHIFGTGGGEHIARQYGVPLLGQLPLDGDIREQADSGSPTVASAPDSAQSQAYVRVARSAAAHMAAAMGTGQLNAPAIVIEEA